MSKIIIARSVTKALGKVRAVRDVSLDVEKGEFLAIEGSSGSGKTTLLGLLAGLEKPDQGHIAIDGQDLTLMSEDQLSLFRRYNIGFVFQSFNLIPTLNAVENIALPLFPERLSKKSMLDRAKEAANSVGLGERLDHYPSEISGGEQQRVAIARSLINDPKVVLADEPTGNLDTETGGRIIELLKRLNKTRQLTLVLVTHDDKIASESGSIIKLIDGRIANE